MVAEHINFDQTTIKDNNNKENRKTDRQTDRQRQRQREIILYIYIYNTLSSQAAYNPSGTEYCIYYVLVVTKEKRPLPLSFLL